MSQVLVSIPLSLSITKALSLHLDSDKNYPSLKMELVTLLHIET